MSLGDLWRDAQSTRDLVRNDNAASGLILMTAEGVSSADRYELIAERFYRLLTADYRILD